MTLKTDSLKRFLLLPPEQDAVIARMDLFRHRLRTRQVEDFREIKRSLLYEDETILVHDFFATADSNHSLILGLFLEDFSKASAELTLQDFVRGKYFRNLKLQDLFYLSASRKILCFVIAPSDVPFKNSDLPTFHRRADQSVAVVFLNKKPNPANLEREILNVLIEFLDSSSPLLDSAYCRSLFTDDGEDRFSILENFGALIVELGSCPIHTVDEPPLKNHGWRTARAEELKQAEEKVLGNIDKGWKWLPAELPSDPGYYEQLKLEIRHLKFKKTRTVAEELQIHDWMLQIGIRQTLIGNVSGALKQLLDVIVFLKGLPEPTDTTHRMLFTALLWYGNLWVKRKNYDSALQAWEEAISVQERFAGDGQFSWVQTLFIYDALCQIYNKKGNPDAVEFFIDEKYKYLRKYGEKDAQYKDALLVTTCQHLVFLLKYDKVQEALDLSRQLLEAFYDGTHDLSQYGETFNLAWSHFSAATERRKEAGEWERELARKGDFVGNLHPPDEATWHLELQAEHAIDSTVGWVFHEFPQRFLETSHLHLIQEVREKFIDHPSSETIRQKMLNWTLQVGYLFSRSRVFAQAHEFFHLAQALQSEFPALHASLQNVFVLYAEAAGAAAHACHEPRMALFWTQQEFSAAQQSGCQAADLLPSLYRYLYAAIRAQDVPAIEKAVKAALPLLELPVEPIEVHSLMLCKTYLLCVKTLQEQGEGMETRLIRLNNERIVRVTLHHAFSIREIASLYLQYYQNFMTSTQGAAYLSLKALHERSQKAPDFHEDSNDIVTCFRTVMKLGLFVQYLISHVHPEYHVLFAKVLEEVLLFEPPESSSYHLVEYFFLAVHHLHRKDPKHPLPLPLRKYLRTDHSFLWKKVPAQDHELLREGEFEILHSLINSQVETRKPESQHEIDRVLFQACFVSDADRSQWYSTLALAVEQLQDQDIRYAVNRRLARLLGDHARVDPKRFSPFFIRVVKNMITMDRFVSEEAPFMELLLFQENQLFDPKHSIKDNTIIATQWKLVDLYLRNKDHARARRVFALNVKNITACLDKPLLDISELKPQIQQCQVKLELLKPIRTDLRDSLKLMCEVFRENIFSQPESTISWSQTSDTYSSILNIEISLGGANDLWSHLLLDIQGNCTRGYVYCRIVASVALTLFSQGCRSEELSRFRNQHDDFIVQAFRAITENTTDLRCPEVFCHEALVAYGLGGAKDEQNAAVLNQLLRMHIEHSVWNLNVPWMIAALFEGRQLFHYPDQIAMLALEMLKKARDTAPPPSAIHLRPAFDDFPDGALFKPNNVILATVYLKFHIWAFDQPVLKMLFDHLPHLQEKANTLHVHETLRKYVIQVLSSIGNEPQM